jgi:hypothetical protein
MGGAHEGMISSVSMYMEFYYESVFLGSGGQTY